MADPCDGHYRTITQVLIYVIGSLGGQFFPSDIDRRIRAFMDSDWVGCSNTRKSVTGFCVFLGNALISWRSKKQSIESRSSCEIQWLTFLVCDLGKLTKQPTSLYSDKQSAIHKVIDLEFHELTEHSEVD